MKRFIILGLSILLAGCASTWYYAKPFKQYLAELEAAHAEGKIDEATYLQLKAQTIAAAEANYTNRAAAMVGYMGVTQAASTLAQPQPTTTQTTYYGTKGYVGSSTSTTTGQ